MILRRVDQLLENHEVTILNTLHQPFDPQYMRALLVEHDPNLPDGFVTLEELKGYKWQDEILRVAEVRVNQR